MSSLTLSHHLTLGRPLGLLPSGVHRKACLMSREASARRTWPAHLSLPDLTIPDIGGRPVRARTSRAYRRRHMFRSASNTLPQIVLRILFSKLSSFFSIRCVVDHTSDPYKATGLMTVLYTASLTRRDRIRDLSSRFRLPAARFAAAIL